MANPRDQFLAAIQEGLADAAAGRVIELGRRLDLRYGARKESALAEVKPRPKR